jgi:hypothetical protein
MKKNLIILLFVLFFSQISYSQQFSHEFGKLSGDDLLLKGYSRAPDAEAVVICDIGKVEFVDGDRGFTYILDRYTKIKIMNKAGLRWAQVEIPYYTEDNSYEEIYDIEANTYNYENGALKKTAFDKTTIYNEKIDKRVQVKKLALPNVKEGSVIEYHYKIVSPFVFQFPTWEFQKEIPVIHSEYTTAMIPYFEYSYVLQGASKFDENKSFPRSGNMRDNTGRSLDDMVYYYAMNNVPAFKKEAYLSSADDYIMKLDFQLSAYYSRSGAKNQVMSTWPKLVDELLSEDKFGRYLKSGKKKAQEIVDTMNLTPLSALQKAQKIDRFMKSSFIWNNYYRKLTNQSVKDLLKTKTGTSAEINLFYNGMLNAAGIEANPVLISTRHNGRIKTIYPMLTFFNDVLVMATINGENYILDATDPLAPFSVLPYQCLNEKGLIIADPKDPKWLEYHSSVSSANVYEMDLTPNLKTDSLDCQFKILSYGYDALDARHKHSEDKQLLKKSLNLHGLHFADSLEIQNTNLLDSAFIIKFDAKQSFDIVENKIIISPFCNIPLTENPFKSFFRDYPVDFVYHYDRSFVSIINIPEGYNVLTKPENLTLNFREYKLIVKTEMLGNNKLKVSGLYGFAKSTYQTNEYDKLRDLFNRMVTKLNEKVILEKK